MGSRADFRRSSERGYATHIRFMEKSLNCRAASSKWDGLGMSSSDKKHSLRMRQAPCLQV
jgi:hypothetical protein